jgi:hypothetical protein
MTGWSSSDGSALHNDRMPVLWTNVEQQLKDDGNIAFLCDIVVPAAEVGDW